MQNKIYSSSTNKTKIQGKLQQPNRKDKRLFVNHKKALVDAWVQCRETFLSTLITCLVIAVSILLTSSLFLMVKTFQRAADYINSSYQVTLYLKSDQQTEAQKWLETLKKDPLVKEATYISPEQALEELTSEGDFKNILINVENNPLPPVILLKLNTTDKMEIKAFADRLKIMPAVQSVNIDFDWLQRLFSLIKLGNRIAYALTILFGIGVLFIVSHSIQSATQRNQEEMHILQLIGAPISYIRRPFLYLGSLLGLGAGFISSLLLIVLFFSIKQPLIEFLHSYNFEYQGNFFDAGSLFLTLIISTLIGWLGAWFAFYRYAQ